MQIPFIDAHLHLQDPRFGKKVQAIIASAETSGVCRFFCNATREADWPQVVELAAGNSWIVPFLGIHPWFADEASPGWQDRLIETLAPFTLSNGTGIGETGLDKSRPVDFTLQQNLLRCHLEIGADLDLPLALHCVQAWGPLLDILESFAAVRALPQIMIHSFNGSAETMRRLVALGCFISYSPALGNADNSALRETFCQTPVSAILLETDSPYAKLPGKGSVVEPLAVTYLYRSAAFLCNMHIFDFSNIIWNNAAIFANRAIAR